MVEKILIVDDDLETLRLVGLMLQGQGYQIIAANSGAQAITQTRAENPSLILLDIMMPDMDGLEVARRLRSLPAALDIPILMFTAKTQTADKVAGYEAGADDYLTKPVHPKLLLEHVKALLSRVPTAPVEASKASPGGVIGVVAARGGMGVSNVALNLGIAIHQKTGEDTILAEYRPGRGSWRVELDLPTANGIARLLKLDPGLITTDTVASELVRHDSGVRFLLSEQHPAEAISTRTAASQLPAILEYLSGLAPHVVVDLGDGTCPGFLAILNRVDQLILVVDNNPVTIQMTRPLLGTLRDSGFGQQKPLSLALVQRVRFDTLSSWSHVEEQLGLPVTQVITPFPELTHQASLHHTAMILLQPGGWAASQFEALAEHILKPVLNV